MRSMLSTTIFIRFFCGSKRVIEFRNSLNPKLTSDLRAEMKSSLRSRSVNYRIIYECNGYCSKWGGKRAKKFGHRRTTSSGSWLNMNLEISPKPLPPDWTRKSSTLRTSTSFGKKNSESTLRSKLKTARQFIRDYFALPI